MKKKITIGLLSLSVLACLLFAAENKYSVRVPGGLATASPPPTAPEWPKFTGAETERVLSGRDRARQDAECGFHGEGQQEVRRQRGMGICGFVSTPPPSVIV